MSDTLQKYYRIHSKIYDLTRWSFLFGRTSLIRKISRLVPAPSRILEIGCGTGRNTLELCHRLPHTQITGLDLSLDMLDVAQKKLSPFADRITLINQAYSSDFQPLEPVDLILFSYTLTMINPGWEEAIECAAQDLTDNGIIAVVDFHNTPFSFFRKWMRTNHVEMTGHLLPKLQQTFSTIQCSEPRAYLGIWQYLIYVGQKPSNLNT